MAQLKTIRLPVSANLKLLLVLFALAIVAGTLWFTQQLVSELKEAEQRTITFYANTLQTLLNTPQESSASSEITSELAYQAAGIIYFPIVTTDAKGNPLSNPVTDSAGNTRIDWVAKNIDFDAGESMEKQEQQLRRYAADMGDKYAPLPIYSLVERVDQVPQGTLL